jgi:hypothetical protein
VRELNVDTVLRSEQHLSDAPLWLGPMADEVSLVHGYIPSRSSAAAAKDCAICVALARSEAKSYAGQVPFIVLAIALLIPLALIVLVPLSIIQRYRVGTSRRRARTWVAVVNLAAIGGSVGLFLAAAAVTSVWVPDALSYTLIGLAAGCLVGLAGLRLTRWEATPYALHYTPNKWLVLSLTLVVSARLVYGLWRGWDAWHAAPTDASWVAASGAAGSLGAGAVVLGYYLAFWAGVRRRVLRHLRTMTGR